ncbi:MAG: sarcosine oxidase subunit alpha family protein [Granulosicoccus sp.]|nr:sarcosine oxidase subunit alpha family protein [Granulosicoccus sp.]
MQQKNRLDSGGRIERDKPLSFLFADRRLMGYAGDTLASALLANGVDVVGRSFKYSRARGIMTAGVEEPNAILQTGATESTQTPNIKATEQSLYEGLVCRPVNGWPSVNTDVMSVLGRLGGALMSPGFYYKTFMWPKSQWETYEKFIRRAAGLGRSPTLPDADRYDHMHHHVDVMVVGAGPAGLMAALSAARQGARVLLADERSEAGGSLLFSRDSIEGKPAMEWVADVVTELDASDSVTRLARSTVTGYHDHNFLTISERRSDHLGDRAPAHMSRQRLHKVRAGSVVLATGAHERPLVFANNDLPGCMLASSVSHYIQRFAVVPGTQLVVMTSNDSAYQAAFDWVDAGRKLVAIVDTRRDPDGAVTQMARQRGMTLITGSALIEARGRHRVSGAVVSPINAAATFVTGELRLLPCDTIATSGGWSPVVHLSCHTGSRPVWSDEKLGFVPGSTSEARFCAGAINGTLSLDQCLAEGVHAGSEAATAAHHLSSDRIMKIPASASGQEDVCAAMPVFLVPHTLPSSRAPKQFVDMQNDVTAAGIQMSTQEGFESIEHVKRYTALGFGTDQGKTGNVNGMAIVAHALGKTLAETGTTVFRPNYTPVSFGVVAGASTDLLFDPQRFTPMHAWHLQRGAVFENVGQWKRPLYFPQGDESMAQAIVREQLATRNGVGILDASTLGKIDIQGRDAREFLGRVYTNAWAKLAPGRCRYGLMCGEDGMIMDDGVTSCLAQNHFLMTTTTGGAAHVLSWLEIYQQTEWPELEVFFNSVTDHWATMSIAGPDSRNLLATLTDLDLSAESFGFMDWREATVAGIPARIFRISFTGDLSYEINVPAHYGLALWEALFEAGAAFGLTPYGTETMHVLRAEKGFIIVGQDTDGSMTPYDMNHGWAVANNKEFSFIGKRGMNRSDCLRTDRKQLVGLMTTDPSALLPEGAQAVRDPAEPIPMTMVGHVTSSYHSAFLGRRIAMAVIKDGLQRMGEKVYFPLAGGELVEAVICDPVFVDPQGIRQKA